MKPTTRLEKLLIEEVSGVGLPDGADGGPANMLPGFMVYKSRDGIRPLLKAVADDSWIDRAVAGLDQETLRLFARRIEESGASGSPASRATPPPPAAADVPTSESPVTKKALGLFRPAEGYRRIW